MAKVNTNITLDPQLKSSAQSLFSELGLDLSTAISLFLSQAVREQAIPFQIKMEVPNKETVAAINEVEEMERHPEKYKSFNSVDALMEDLLS